MTNKFRHLLHLALGLGSFALASQPAWSAGDLCQAQFERGTHPLISKNALIKASTEQEESVRLKETIELQDRFKQFPETPLIDSRFIKRGDVEEVVLYPLGSPGYQRPSGAPAVHAVALSARGSQLVAGASNGAYSQVELKTIVKRYLTEVEVELTRDFDGSMFEHLTIAALANPRTVEDAIRYHLREKGEGGLSNEQLITLTKTGIGRHFAFTPVGLSRQVPARVLDLHPQNSPYGFMILVEWMTEATDSGIRTRHITMLRPNELSTIGQLSPQQKAEIAQVFNDSLSPNEIKTRELARALKVRTFGHADMHRASGMSDGLNPLRMMSNASHLAMRAFIYEHFRDKLTDLLTPEEKSEPHFPVIDVMARLNPRYILKRFESMGDGFSYAFVVTEDGQLKISPHGYTDANLMPQLPRLAHGRRIFAGGRFTINADGSLKVILDANNYQTQDARMGGEFAFHTANNGDVDAFVMGVFYLQAGREVKTVGAKEVEQYFTGRSDQRESDASAQADARSGQGQTSNGFESDSAYDFINGLRRGSPESSNAAKLDWDAADAKARPLSFQNWSR